MAGGGGGEWLRCARHCTEMVVGAGRGDSHGAAGGGRRLLGRDLAAASGGFRGEAAGRRFQIVGCCGMPCPVYGAGDAHRRRLQLAAFATTRFTCRLINLGVVYLDPFMPFLLVADASLLIIKVMHLRRLS